MRTESKLKCLICLVFGVLFPTLLDGAELGLTRNESLSYLLFITHIIYKALIYSSDTEGRHILHLVKMPHTLSITWALVPFVKEWITYLKPVHRHPDSSTGEQLYSMIAAITVSALKTCKHTQRKCSKTNLQSWPEPYDDLCLPLQLRARNEIPIIEYLSQGLTAHKMF